jgi:PAS domain S-box-containing protein
MATHATLDASVIAPILDLLPDAIIWVRPVLGAEGAVDDFEVAYANEAAHEVVNHPKGVLSGLRILRDGVPSQPSAEANFRHFLDVYQSGEVKEHSFFAHHSGRQMETIRRPYRDGVLSMIRDRRAQREAERKEQEKTQLLNGVVDNAPIGIEVYEAVRDAAGGITDFRIKLYNSIVHKLTGVPEEDRRRLSFRELLRGLGANEVFARYLHTVETGEPFAFEYHSPVVDRWLQLSVVKLGDGFLVMMSDIEEVKRAHATLQQQSDYLHSVLDASPAGIYTCEAVRDEQGDITDLRYTQVNEMFGQIIGIGQEEVVGRTMLELFPTVKTTDAFQAYCTVIETGVPTRLEVYYKGEGLDAWYDISASKVGVDGAVVIFSDVTDKKMTFLEVERQKALLDNLLQYSPSGISVVKALRDERGAVVDFRNILINDRAAEFTGLPKEVLLTRTNLEIDPHFAGSPACRMLVDTLQTGAPGYTDYRLQPTGKWIEGAVSKMDADHLICIITDVTAAREIQQLAEQSHEKLRTVMNTSQAGIFTGVPVLDDQGVIADFRFTMVNQVLASFTGQPSENLVGELGSRWFARYKTNGLFERFRDTYTTGSRQQFDFHYLGDKLEAWVNIMTTRLGEELLVSFTDFTPIKRLQLQLESSVDELKRSNANLEEFAHAASHDLKEPIRKIHTFSSRLKDRLSGRMDESERAIFERMESAAERMSQLVEDLLQYSQVSMGAEGAQEVDLSEKIRTALADLELPIEEKGATVTMGELPVVRGYGRQLQQLFQNLVSNALKYSQPGVAPQVSITARRAASQDLPGSADPAKEYHLIEVRDNGIGFEQQYAERIFQMFQRLHGRSEYPGTGVGLSIVRKVAENHGGYVTATSTPGEGATFSVLLPA